MQQAHVAHAAPIPQAQLAQLLQAARQMRKGCSTVDPSSSEHECL